MSRLRLDSKTVTTLTVIAPSRRRPGIPSRKASSGIVSSLRPGAVTSPLVSAAKPPRRATSSSAEVEQRLDLGAVEDEHLHPREPTREAAPGS